MNTKDLQKRYTAIIIATWLVNLLAGFGRYSYAAVMTDVILSTGALKSEAGAVTAYMFISYAVAQIIFSFLVHRVPTHYPVCIAVLISAGLNIALPYCSVSTMKWLWLLNGVLHSMTYITSMNLLSRCLPKERLPFASTMMAVFTPACQLVMFGLAAICVKFWNWTLLFWICAACMLVAVVIWFLTVKSAEKLLTEETSVTTVVMEKKTGAFWYVFIVSLVVCVVYGVFNQSIMAWMPIILVENFSIESPVAYLLMDVVILVATLTPALTLWITTKIHNYSRIVVLAFAAIIPTALCVVFYAKGGLALFLIPVLLIIVFANVINNISISFEPMKYRAYASSGFISGITNAAVCVGSAVCNYGFGSLLDRLPWQFLFWIMAGVSLIIIIPLVFSSRASKKLLER